MGKKTEAKVQDFRENYEACQSYIKEFESLNRKYVPQIARLKKASQKVPDTAPVPIALQASFNEIENIMQKLLPPLVVKADGALMRTNRSLVALNKWVDDKSKKDPTTWRKIKDTFRKK
ncbi:MAG: hypothetical protein AAF442_04695 [Pseudomonadota bacterium]